MTKDEQFIEAVKSRGSKNQKAILEKVLKYKEWLKIQKEKGEI